MGISIAFGARRRAAREQHVVEVDAAVVRRGIGIAVSPIVILLAFGALADRSIMNQGPIMATPEPGFAAPSFVADSVTSRGVEVENIYAYDAEGNRIEDVRLYDQFGEPLNIGVTSDIDTLRRPASNADGVEILNVFPIRYVDPESGVVDNPDAGWPEKPGPVVTVDHPSADVDVPPASPSGVRPEAQAASGSVAPMEAQASGVNPRG